MYERLVEELTFDNLRAKIDSDGPDGVGDHELRVVVHVLRRMARKARRDYYDAIRVHC